MAKTIELTDDQLQILAEMIKNVLGDMSYEIADTDNSEYKAELKQRRDALKALAEQINS